MLGMTAPIVTEGRRAEDRALLTDRYANTRMLLLRSSDQVTLNQVERIVLQADLIVPTLEKWMPGEAKRPP